jgi:hypothetical protein
MKKILYLLFALLSITVASAQAGTKTPPEQKDGKAAQKAKGDQSGAANVPKPKGFTGTDAVKESTTGGRNIQGSDPGVQTPAVTNKNDATTDPPGKKANYNGTPKNNNTGTKGRDTIRRNDAYRN